MKEKQKVKDITHTTSLLVITIDDDDEIDDDDDGGWISWLLMIQKI